MSQKSVLFSLIFALVFFLYGFLPVFFETGEGLSKVAIQAAVLSFASAIGPVAKGQRVFYGLVFFSGYLSWSYLLATNISKDQTMILVCTFGAIGSFLYTFYEIKSKYSV